MLKAQHKVEDWYMNRLIIFSISALWIAGPVSAQDTGDTSTRNTAYKKLKETHIIYDKDTDEVERMWGRLSPDQKCTDIDARIIHGCLKPRFFNPSARVYFDTGNDDPGEIDVFNDGGLNPTIDFAAVYLPWRFGHAAYFDDWSWGPIIGVGISAPTNSAEGDSDQSSDAPVVMVSLGIMLEYEIAEGGTSLALEFGRAIGFSADESLDDSDDSATFVGLKINVPLGEKESKKVKVEDAEKAIQ